MASQDDANLKVIISRIQQRRGLKQDLPQPLRPGEIGFATDSKQVYIGADTDDAISATYNKTVYLENTLGASARTLSLANSQIIKFTVPHIRWPKGSGTFDGVSKSRSWSASTNITSTSGVIDSDGNVVQRTVFDSVVASDDFINNNRTSRAFKADEITVLVDGVELKGDSSGTSSIVNAAYDFNFISGNASTSDHVLYLRTAPENSQDVAVTYYSNTTVYNSISNTIIASGANITGFHANKSIPEYRYITSDLVFVNPDVGTGFIGLETKHIDVVAEGTGIASVNSVNLGNVVIAKDPLDPALYSVDSGGDQIYSGFGNVTAVSDSGNSTIVFDTGNENLSFVNINSAQTGDNCYLWTEFADGSNIALTSYLHKKLLPVINSSEGTQITTELPSNAFQTGRSVSTSSAVAGVVTITGNTAGLKDGDYVYFGGANADGSGGSASTYFPNSSYVVSFVSPTNFKVTEANVTSSLAGDDLFYVNYGIDNSGGNVQVVSSLHGLPDGLFVDITSSSNISMIPNSNVSVITSANPGAGGAESTSTFFISTLSPVLSNVTGNFTPVIDDVVEADALTIKEGKLIRLSGASTVNSALNIINNPDVWLRASLKPNINDEVYVTSDDQSQYRLFNDPRDTSINSWEELGIVSHSVTNTNFDKYTRELHTVKAKLEEWVSSVLQDSKVNTISGIYVNEPYSSGSFDTWDIDVDTTNDEINFNSNIEAGNFAQLVNRLYFKTNDPDKRGLVNLKTNIEMLTTQSLESGQSETLYSQPLQLTIGSNSNVLLSDLGTDTNSIDTLFVDYSIVGTALDVSDPSITRYYNRVGTLMYNANPLSGNDGTGNISGTITLQDVSSSSGDNYFNGNLTFQGYINNGIVSITANNSLSPSTSNVVMKYVVRKWKSQ